MKMPWWRAQIAVTFRGLHESSTLLTELVGPAGFFAKTDAPPPPMHLMRARLELPPTDPLVMQAMVVATTQPRNPHAAEGIEVRFFTPSRESTERWEAFLEYVRATHPEAASLPVLLAQDTAGLVERDPIVETLRAGDVSPRGIFVATRHHLAIGTDVSLIVSEPRSAAKCAIEGVVIRRVVGGREGFGVAYRSMTPRGWSELASMTRVAMSAGWLSAEIRVVRDPNLAFLMDTLEAASPFGDVANLTTPPPPP